MSRPLCIDCESGDPCTGWAVGEDDDGSPYWTRCPGHGRVTIGRSATDDRHADGGHG